MDSAKNFLGRSATTGDTFIAIEDFHGDIGDPIHIDGAIELTANGVQILSKQNWDFLDQLWTYLLQGLRAALQGDNFSCYFPDSPTAITFRPRQTEGDIDFTVGPTTVLADRQALTSILAEGAEDCFSHLALLIKDTHFYDEQKALIGNIRHLTDN